MHDDPGVCAHILCKERINLSIAHTPILVFGLSDHIGETFVVSSEYSIQSCTSLSGL